MYNVKYAIVKDTLSIEGISYNTYGIIVLFNNKPIRYISDIFLNENEIESFVSLCNELKLSPIHLDEVIDDIIGH
ncbi:MAG: DUF6514 family protein [Clostridia bacterium]|nr:DUF6514 family protein [Clostridia bacterium]